MSFWTRQRPKKKRCRDFVLCVSMEGLGKFLPMCWTFQCQLWCGGIRGQAEPPWPVPPLSPYPASTAAPSPATSKENWARASFQQELPLHFSKLCKGCCLNAVFNPTLEQVCQLLGQLFYFLSRRPEYIWCISKQLQQLETHLLSFLHGPVVYTLWRTGKKISTSF